jgi:hypothetical protein
MDANKYGGSDNELVVDRDKILVKSQSPSVGHPCGGPAAKKRQVMF